MPIIHGASRTGNHGPEACLTDAEQQATPPPDAPISCIAAVLRSSEYRVTPVVTQFVQPTPLELLKSRTRLHHERAEAAMPALDETLTLDRYRDTLVRFHGVYAPLEARLAELPHWTTLSFDFGARRKSGLIERDLQMLGYGDSEIARLPRAERLPDVRTLPRSVGVLYVMEGATLGGQVIQRLVRRELGLGTGALSFFSSYGERVGAMWGEFRAFVTRSVTSAEDAEAMVSAASETFDVLTAWLSGGEVERAA